MMISKKRVLICAVKVPFVIGGAEYHIDNLFKNLIKRGYETELIRLPFKWYPHIELFRNALLWRSFNFNKINYYDVVIATKFPTYLIRHKNKVVWLLHQHRQVYELLGTPYTDFQDSIEDYQYMNYIYEIDTLALLESKKIFANSKTVSNRLLRYLAIPSEPLYHPPPLAEHIKPGNYDNYIIFMGRLELNKRVHLLIELSKYLSSKVKVYIVGKGPQEKNLKSLVEKYKLNDKIIFTGFVDEKKLLKLLSNSLAVFYAPYQEDYGYVTIEAFLAEKPVLTTYDSGGVMEFVHHKENGFVVKPDKIFKLAEYVNLILEDKSLAEKMGKNGREKIADINWDYVIERLINF